MRRLIRRLRALAAAALAGAAVAAASAQDQVLVLSERGDRVLAPLAQALAARTAAGRPTQMVLQQFEADDMQWLQNLGPKMRLQGDYRVVVATAGELARLAQLMRPDVPQVFSFGADPTMICLVDTLQRPGRNATGSTGALYDGDKSIDALVDGFPALRRVVVLVDAGNLHPADCSLQEQPPPPPCRPGLHEPDAFVKRLVASSALLAHAARRGVELRFLMVCTAADLARVDALATPDTGFIVPYMYRFYEQARPIVARMARLRRPAVYGHALFEPLGGLIVMEKIEEPDDVQATVAQVMAVLDGASPSEMPVILPRSLRLTWNAWAAAQQGLQPTLALLRRADRIVVTPPRVR